MNDTLKTDESSASAPGADDKSCCKCLRKVWKIFLGLVPIIFLVYLGLVFRAGWNADKGAAKFSDKEILKQMSKAGCPELGKFIVPNFAGGRNHFVFENKYEYAFFVQALEEKPECLALGVLAWTPSRDGSADSTQYYYDEKSNKPIFKITVEYLNPRRQ